MKYILEYRLKVSAMLKDHDAARTAFNSETLFLEENINKKCSDKSFVSFIVGSILTTMIFSGIFYYIKKHDTNNNILDTIEKTIKG
jgi:hypothetical protein